MATEQINPRWTHDDADQDVKLRSSTRPALDASPWCAEETGPFGREIAWCASKFNRTLGGERAASRNLHGNEDITFSSLLSSPICKAIKFSRHNYKALARGPNYICKANNQFRRAPAAGLTKPWWRTRFAGFTIIESMARSFRSSSVQSARRSLS